MTTERILSKGNLSGRALLCLVLFAAGAISAVLSLMNAAPVHAQAAAQNPGQSIADTWQGTLHAGKDLRIVVKITKAADGSYKADFYSIDQGGQPFPVNKITLDGATLKFSVSVIGGAYEGKLSADAKTISGNWSQGPNPMPLALTRATPETAWAIPEPPPVIPPMDANADPSFEVATIRPSKPDENRKFLTVQGRKMVEVNYSFKDLLAFAYGVHSTQIQGLPAWAESDRYDITGQPDGEGMPNGTQLKGMIQKLLADRYKLKFHRDKKELSVYLLSVAKSGAKLTKSARDPKGLPGIGFRQLGALFAVNASMSDFCVLGLQGTVLDRPVLNQTGIDGKFDFTLNWTPDDSQFTTLGVKVPPPADAANAPPNLYTAIQEQLGLKLEATKAPAEVLVVDHVEKPTDN